MITACINAVLMILFINDFLYVVKKIISVNR